MVFHSERTNYDYPLNTSIILYLGRWAHLPSSELQMLVFLGFLAQSIPLTVAVYKISVL